MVKITVNVPIHITDSEMLVLKEVMLGKTNGQIAKKLYVVEATVKAHLSKLFTKFKVNNRVQLVLRAQELGL